MARLVAPFIVPLICLAVVAVCTAVVLVMTWELEPWWRKFPTPRRQIDDDRDQVRCYRLRKRHPQVFGTVLVPPSPPTGTRVGEVADPMGSASSVRPMKDPYKGSTDA